MKKDLHLEGLRGIAAFAVFMGHFRATFFTDIDQRFLNIMGIVHYPTRVALENIFRIFYDGFLAVYIFWFMSAYVISIKLFSPLKNENNKYLIEASTKRYFRLAIPVFFSSLICFILMRTHTLYNHLLITPDGWVNRWYTFDPGIIHFLKTTIVMVFMQGNSNYNMVLWTMYPELFGSFLCFGLFAVIGRNKYRFLIYFVVLFFLFIAGIRDVFYFYYFAFACGIIWADAIHSSDVTIMYRKLIIRIFNSKIVPLFLLLCAFGITIYSDLYSPVPPWLYYFLSLPVKGIGIVLLIHNTGFLKKILSTDLLRLAGKISFSFYLLHIPLMFSLGIYFYLHSGLPMLSNVIVTFLGLVFITVGLAWLFEKYIDRNAVKISNRIGRFFSSSSDTTS